MKIESAMFLGRKDHDQLVRIYMDCFAEHPWYEKFKFEDVKKDLLELTHSWEGINFVVRKNDLIAGALFARPLVYVREFSEFIPQEIDEENVMCVVEVFVRKKFRRQGIAKTLFEECVKMTKEYQYTHIMQRTNFESKMFPLIEKTGHKLIGIQKVISRKKMGGTIAEIPEKRGIFLKEL